MALKITFTQANDEMKHYVSYHRDLHCLFPDKNAKYHVVIRLELWLRWQHKAPLD